MLFGYRKKLTHHFPLESPINEAVLLHTEKRCVPHRGTPSSSPRNDAFLGGEEIDGFCGSYYSLHVGFGSEGSGLLDEHQVADDAVGKEDAFAGEAQLLAFRFQLAAFQIGSGGVYAVLPQFGAELLLYLFQGYAPHGAQGGHDVFVVAGRRVQTLGFAGTLPALHGADVAA